MKAWKLRKLGEDIVWDLRNRGLLPVAALLGVALVVLPVLILQGGKKAPSADSSDATAPASIAAPETESAVLAYDPGVRDYRKRLEALASKDPFKQQFQAGGSDPAAALTTVASTLGGSDTGSLGTTSVGGEITSGGGGGSGGSIDSGDSGETETVVTQTKYLSYDLNVSVGEAGSMKTHRNVEQLSYLPSVSTPVLAFLGIAGNGTEALFLVSSDVSAASGDGECTALSGSGCQLLAMRRGEVENLSYDPDGKVYRLKVLGIEKHVRVVSG